MVMVTMADNQRFKRMSLLLKDPDIYSAKRYIPHCIVRASKLYLGFLAVLWFVKSSDIAYRRLVSCLYCASRSGLHALCAIYADEHLAALSMQKNNCMNGPVDPLISGIAST